MKVVYQFYGALLLRSYLLDAAEEGAGDIEPGQLWFSAPDVARILQASSVAGLLRSALTVDIRPLALAGAGTWTLSLQGLIRVANRSRKEAGVQFCLWLTGELLAGSFASGAAAYTPVGVNSSQGPSRALGRALSSGQLAAALGRADDARLHDRLISVANKLGAYSGVDLWIGQAGKVLWFDAAWLDYFLAAYAKDAFIDRRRTAWRNLQRLVRDNPEQLLTLEQAEQEVEMALRTRV